MSQANNPAPDNHAQDPMQDPDSLPGRLDAGRFSPGFQRLRDLKPESLDLPPSFQQPEKQIQRLEAFDARFLEHLRAAAPKATPKAGPKAASGDAKDAPVAPERAAIDKELQQQRSRVRIEKLKDIKSSLELARSRLHVLRPGAGQTLSQLRNLLLAIQTQLTAAYTGQHALAEAHGMNLVRPFLVGLSEKLDCVSQQQEQRFIELCQNESALAEAIRASELLPLLEKSALLALGQLLDQVVELFMAMMPASAEAPPVSARPAAVTQAGLELLQRACRGHKELLRQLQPLQARLAQPQQQLSLRLLGNTLTQFRQRAIRELQVFQEVCARQHPGLLPLADQIRAQEQRLAGLGRQSRQMTAKLAVEPAGQSPPNPELNPEQTLASEFAGLTERLVACFEALTAECLQKEADSLAEGEPADLDAMFAPW
ncbi:MAG TPA: hypothetical protein V6D23_23115 [Candidatus Obscuribacterales bacterium]